ncbi:MAG: nickel pincer cofactor biosynthesis protein LarC [Oscillospiraceae bacterium]
MRILYFDCGMGAAGDMLTAALLDILPNQASFVEEFNALKIPGVEMRVEQTQTSSIRGLHVHMLVHGIEEGNTSCAHEHEYEHCCDYDAHNHAQHEHIHRGFEEVADLIRALPISEAVRENALGVYGAVAKAEAKVHNRPLSEVHFHELGSMDAVADIVAFCMLIEKLAPDEICASPVHVGSGYVHCAHGILPIPAPATAELLRGIPSYGGEIQGELCTPTGAALLRHFVKKFGPQPVMAAEKIGYGMGTRTFPKANCVRAFIGASEASRETVEEIACNLDDMTGESIGFAMEALLNSGALDVYTVPVGMKKSRPGVMLCCLCRSEDTEKLSSLMLRHTTSLGVRITRMDRVILARSFDSVSTPYGPVRVKTAGGVSKPEYDDLARIARENDMTLGEAAQLIKK